MIHCLLKEAPSQEYGSSSYQEDGSSTYQEEESGTAKDHTMEVPDPAISADMEATKY